jgi:pyruvyltransferase
MIVRACKLRNYGDSLNSELVRIISGITPTIVNNQFSNPDNETIYMCIGSVLGWADKNSIIWGTGKISDTDATMFKEQPKEILAVRGPLTREQIINRGFKCDTEIYGDPALLMPRYFHPILPKIHNLSIIPHQVDKPLIPQIQKEYPSAHIIDVQQSIYGFITEVIQSKYIISSALHGCITAYAYHVPYEHKKFSEKVLGNGFKFQDFEESKPYINLDKLMEVCPFRK